MAVDPVTIRVNEDRTVSGLLQRPNQAVACLVLAHGASAGMTHPFMAAVADGLQARDVATLRFQFPAMESGSRRPDRPAVAYVTIRAAVDAAHRLVPDTPLIAGGKSFGGRMTSQAQAERPLPQVRGLVFLGFPLHPANSKSVERAVHLRQVRVPMLFLQGTRDAMADAALLVAMVDALGTAARLKLIDHADHGFHVPVRSGRTDAQVLADALDEAASWMRAITSRNA